MIRPFQPKDMNAVVSLAREHGREAGIEKVLPIDDIHFTKTLKTLLIEPGNQLFVAEQNGTIIGYALVGVTTKVWNPTQYGDIYFFYIHNTLRNKFLADGLFKQCQTWFKEQGCRFFECSVSLFDENFKGVDQYIKRASTYFEHKGCNYAGDHFVVDLEAEDGWK